MPVRMAAIKKSTNNKCWRWCGEREPSYIVGGNTNWYNTVLWRTAWRFLKKLQTELPNDPAIPLLGIHTEESRTERDTCTSVFTAALFTTAKTWKQPKCPSRGTDTDVVYVCNRTLLSH